MATIFATKGVLTNGIQKLENCDIGLEGYASRYKKGIMDVWVGKKEYFFTEIEAQEAAQKVILKKIASLEKSLQKYKSLVGKPFKVIE